MTGIVSYIGLGSNLLDPATQLKNALSSIHALDSCKVLNCSWLYASKPMGPSDQPNYVNAVASIKTSLSPHALLSALQGIELSQGRERKEQRWGPRTLDLDLLLFGNHQIQTTQLTVPHYGMKEREFVLYPLHQIAPKLILPCGNSLESVLESVSRNGLQVIDKDINWT